MLKKIAILVNYNLYESKRYFTQKFVEALNRKGVETKIFDYELYEKKAQYLNDLQNFAPDLTCSFNSILPLPDGRYLWDWLLIPHLSFLVDPAVYYLDMAKSSYSILSCVDRNDCGLVRSLPFDNVFFFPHAVERELQADPKVDRIYDVVFLGTCNDYESARLDWQARYPAIVNTVLDDAIDLVLSDKFISLTDALVTSLKAHSFTSNELDFSTLFTCLDIYTRGLDRVELIRAIKDPNIRVHIFGEGDTHNAWSKYDWNYYVGSQSNVILHPSVSFPKSLEILKQSKICLNSMPFFKDGTHERIFTGLACGALPVTSASKYIAEEFKHGEDLLMYQPKQWDKAGSAITEFLNDEAKRKKTVENGRKKVMQNHTWDARVDMLLKTLPSIMEKIIS